MSAYDAAAVAELLALSLNYEIFSDDKAHMITLLAAQLRAASDRISQLERALLKYGWHAQRCDFLQNELPCTCGYEELRAALAGAPSEG